MMRFAILLVALIFGVLAKAQNTTEIFDELQENFWYIPIDDRGARLGVTSLGTGDTVVVLHGGPGNNFNYMVDAIRENTATHCFLLFDQRGSIYSPVADSLVDGITLDHLIDDLETLRQETGQEKLTLLGHSFGTLLAMSYYIKYPQCVERIVLTAAMPPLVSQESPFSEVVKGIHRRVKAMRERPLVEEVLRKEGLGNEDALTTRQQSDRYKITGLASFNMVDLHRWREFKGGRVFYNPRVDAAVGGSIPDRYDVRRPLDEQPVPIYVIQGAKDYIDPAASNWNVIDRNYPTVELSIVPDAGHYIWLDKPQEFTEQLNNGLSDN